MVWQRNPPGIVLVARGETDVFEIGPNPTARRVGRPLRHRRAAVRAVIRPCLVSWFALLYQFPT